VAGLVAADEGLPGLVEGVGELGGLARLHAHRVEMRDVAFAPTEVDVRSGSGGRAE